MSMTQLLFSFQGRLNRKPYWMTIIAITVIVLVVLLIALAMAREHRFEFAGVTMAVLVILYIPLVWIGLAIGAKRLHDRDKSAWWLVVFYAIPTILSAAADQTEDSTSRHPASHQLRHHGLGLRRARLSARDDRTQPLRPRPADPAGVDIAH